MLPCRTISLWAAATLHVVDDLRASLDLFIGRPVPVDGDVVTESDQAGQELRSTLASPLSRRHQHSITQSWWPLPQHFRILMTFVSRINRQKEYCLSFDRTLTSRY